MDLMVRMVLILRRPKKVSKMTPKAKFIGCSKVLVIFNGVESFLFFLLQVNVNTLEIKGTAHIITYFVTNWFDVYI